METKKCKVCGKKCLVPSWVYCSDECFDKMKKLDQERIRREKGKKERKNLKDFIFKKLEKRESIHDQILFDYLGREPSYTYVEEIKRKFYRVEKYKNLFKKNYPKRIEKHGKFYYAKVDNEYIKISSDYFNLIIQKYKINNDRLDLKSVIFYDFLG